MTGTGRRHARSRSPPAVSLPAKATRRCCRAWRPSAATSCGRRTARCGSRPALDLRATTVVFEAITVHRDDIEQLPAGAVVLASNDMGLQAIELPHGAGIFWGVQYHPEYSFAEIAATALRYTAALIEEQLFADRAELEAFVNDLRTLMRDPRDRRLTWKHGLGEGVQEDSCRLAELRNWLELQVLPYARRRH
ncbi:MAG: hypothetical protein E6K44_04105 [Gammaproteobacteria bacterium]|nr:MAG: hypothetical protein E6K44_04105 [Gammaproteobacteria bacterium]